LPEMGNFHQKLVWVTLQTPTPGHFSFCEFRLPYFQFLFPYGHGLVACCACPVLR